MVIDLSEYRVTNLGKASQSISFRWDTLLKLIELYDDMSISVVEITS